MHRGVKTLTLALSFVAFQVTVQAQQSSTNSTTKSGSSTTAQKQSDAPRIPPAPATDASRSTKKSDARALAFLRESVDHTMYNLAGQGAKDAVVHMRMPNNTQFQNIEVIHYWTANPYREFTDVNGLGDGMSSFKTIIANQAMEQLHRALLLPASKEFETYILAMENDGDLVKITAESQDPNINTRTMRWYTKEGKLVRGVLEGNNPVTGRFETHQNFDLQAFGNQYIVTGITSRTGERPTQVKVSYADVDNFRVVKEVTVNTPTGSSITSFDVKINKGVDAKVFDNSSNTSTSSGK